MESTKASYLALLRAEAALKAHTLATQDIQLGYQAPATNLEETDFEGLLQAATERHTNSRFAITITTDLVSFRPDAQDHRSVSRVVQLSQKLQR